MIILKCEQHSEAWHQAKLGRFSGSRFAKLMSGESTDGFNDLIINVAAEIISGEPEETFVSADMERGTELEPEARNLYESLFGDVNQVGFVLLDENDPLHDYVGVSPDGMPQDGLLEIKCPKRHTHFWYIKANVLPSIYKWQVQGQLMVTGAKWCDFMSYYPGLKPFIIRVYPDLEMHKQLRDRLTIAVAKVKEWIKVYNEYDYER